MEHEQGHLTDYSLGGLELVNFAVARDPLAIRNRSAYARRSAGGPGAADSVGVSVAEGYK